jgi:hypothetical protein
MLNCKVGDMAVVMGCPNDNSGRVVSCLEYLGNNPIVDGWIITGQTIWRVDRRMNTWSNVADGRVKDHAPFISDEYLMPLYPDEKMTQYFKDEIRNQKQKMKVKTNEIGVK